MEKRERKEQKKKRNLISKAILPSLLLLQMKTFIFMDFIIKSCTFILITS
jgi:hypothetical protein